VLVGLCDGILVDGEKEGCGVGFGLGRTVGAKEGGSCLVGVMVGREADGDDEEMIEGNGGVLGRTVGDFEG